MILLKTVELEEKLRKTQAFDENIIVNNPLPRLRETLDMHINEKGLSKSEVVHILNIDRNYDYQMLNGTRVRASRSIRSVSVTGLS